MRKSFERVEPKELVVTDAERPAKNLYFGKEDLLTSGIKFCTHMFNN